jgi:hypothetical protein
VAAGPDEAFADFHQPRTPIVPQIEAWAKKHRHHVGRRLEGTCGRQQIGASGDLSPEARLSLQHNDLRQLTTQTARNYD